MKAVILAGGQGKRLRPLTDQKPKPLIDVGGKPLMEWQIEWLKSFGVTSFVILAGYLSEKIISHLSDKEKFGIDVEFAIEKQPLGTGGALSNAKKFLEKESEFVMVN